MIDEAVIRTQLERLTPVPDSSRRDWEDVLRRAGYKRTRRRSRIAVVILAAIVTIGGLLAAAPALGFHPVADVLGQEPTASWTWPEGLPGKPVKASTFLVSVNEGANGRFGDRVDLSTLREIVSVGKGEGESSFLAARGINGDVCLTKLAGNGHGSPFACLHDPPKPLGPTVDQQAVLIGMSSGGHHGSVADYASLIGVARADVGRVELELVDGETIELPLNRWRGFGYYATDRQRFPQTLRVYRTWTFLFHRHEKLVGQLALQTVPDLAPTPLCGRGYGPCPPGVKP